MYAIRSYYEEGEIENYIRPAKALKRLLLIDIIKLYFKTVIFDLSGLSSYNSYKRQTADFSLQFSTWDLLAGWIALYFS